jgi:hypothetical protein
MAPGPSGAFFIGFCWATLLFARDPSLCLKGGCVRDEACEMDATVVLGYSWRTTVSRELWTFRPPL